MWRDDRAAGAGYAALLVGAPAVLGLLARRLPAPWLVAATALGTWTVLGSRSLSAEAEAVAAHLRRGDLPAAREQLTHLVGRRTDTLDEAEIARATVESVAENTSDAVVAPLLWGAVAGLPGLLAYRAVNTLDAMVGHHSPRYENFGWASARADDAANYLPARLTAALTAAGRARGGRQRARRPGRGPRGRPPSPEPERGGGGGGLRRRARRAPRRPQRLRLARRGPARPRRRRPPAAAGRHRPGRPAEPRGHRRGGGRVRGHRPGARKRTKVIPNECGLLGPARRVPGAVGLPERGLAAAGSAPRLLLLSEMPGTIRR